ncbi:hypothetical protein CHU32_22695 [Superficieibacter electus]|uniref:Uncharacterized protein n=1 Tax=Superficieibacter electus TaxID=2022662 RepID=A0A2P5GJA3_9ENTR|nr:hypothetical protein CHU33_23115 [Superficieibacter electus]POP43757.1 hypothetical protein CHU32_22695 [Superficieibacter electus]
MVFIARAAAPIFSALAGDTSTIVNRIYNLLLTNFAPNEVTRLTYFASRIYKISTYVTITAFYHS